MNNMRDKVVAVAMSGGVDSAVAAALAARQAGRAFGITAKLTVEYSKCCADEDVCRAAEMCRQLGIEHFTVDLTAEFESAVMQPFMESCTGGETPSPCVNCNRSVKFGALLERAREMGADLLATGHYASVVEKEGVLYLRRGADAVKDQTYFLARLTQDQLRHTVFPLGEMRKREVVRLAEELRLAARKSRESQDLCFVTEGTHGDWVELRSFDTQGPGDVVDVDGKVVGSHRGIHHYTVGQRKGLGIALGYPVYVTAIDAEKNLVEVGPREKALSSSLHLRGLMWSGGAPQENRSYICRIRYNHRPATCRVFPRDNGEADVVFDEPQFAVTPGQLAVFYDGQLLVGSGWIVK